MTIDEKRSAILNHCMGTVCDECALYNPVGHKERCFSYDANIERNYDILFGNKPSETESAIEHPSHYRGEKYECIEVMLEVFGVEFTKAFCLGNAFKYLWRCGKKHRTPYEDIAKAMWYLEKYRSLEGGAEKDGRQDDTGTEGA